MAIKFPTIFKTQEPKKFDFKPRYYNERKEKMEERIRRAEAENESGDMDAERAKAGIRDLYSNRRMKRPRVQNRQSNIRLAVIIAILFFITYLILK